MSPRLHIMGSTDPKGSNVRSWMKAFPDPSNSPAHYTRDLRIYEPLTAKSTWVRSFHRVERLLVFTVGFEDSPEASLVQLHGLAPTLRSLCLSHEFLPPLEVFNLVCSFPLLEDVTLYRYGLQSSDEWVAPSTSPRFTGTLHLMDEIHSATRGLLDLPGGLHFAKIVMNCPVEDAVSAMDLVSRCSDTLESFCINNCSSSMFPSALEVCQCLTAGV